MKEIFKKGAEKAPAGGAVRPVSSGPEVAGFLDRLAHMPKKAGQARLLFCLDATASRQPTWDAASRLQADMFASAQALGGLNVQLCYFRGLAGFFASGWQSDPDSLLRVMTRIRCEAGLTQLERLLRHAIAENARGGVKAVVFIGDAMEENIDMLAQLAGELGLLNVPLFMFQEGADPVAKRAFAEMCRLSGGAWAPFDAASAGQLRELLKAAAVYAAGGLKALRDFSRGSRPSVKLLERQLRR